MAGWEIVRARRSLRRGSPHAARGVFLLVLTGLLVVGGLSVAAAVTPRIIAAVHSRTATVTTPAAPVKATAPAKAATAKSAASAATIATSVAAAAAPATKAAPAVPAGAAVGPLFPGGLAAGHTCTASVVDSPAGNVIVTAAHCVSGSVAGVVFAPGYAHGTAPYGSWVVTAAYVDPSWISSQASAADYAFLVVKPAASNSTTESVQDVVGGNSLGTAPGAGTRVTVTGYASGTGSTPIVCSAAVTETGSWPTFGCEGYVGGTSGGPWVSGTTVTGVIGGLNQGGCQEQISYTAPFSSVTAAVYARASSGGSADTLPKAGGDGC